MFLERRLLAMPVILSGAKDLIVAPRPFALLRMALARPRMISAMLRHPQFDPIALDLSRFGIPLAIHWYGITYLVGFALFSSSPGGAHGCRSSRSVAGRGATSRTCSSTASSAPSSAAGLGYVLFYKPGYYALHPLEIFMVWKGGMAFHGGLLGVIVAIALFARSRKRAFLEVTDLVAPCVPTGFAAGRIGNFINGELWGRFADPSLPWAMVFPQSGSLQPRHPSQLYQFLLEGLLLFVVLWIYGKKPRGLGQVSGAFLVGYGVLRFIAEFFRQPDEFLGYLTLDMTMGQWLCVPMVVAGVALWLWGRGRAAAPAPPRPLQAKEA
jgi:phosphatidylglycerol:prolipoprotein diacylglycerol transferase